MPGEWQSNEDIRLLARVSQEEPPRMTLSLASLTSLASPASSLSSMSRNLQPNLQTKKLHRFSSNRFLFDL